MKSFIFIFFSIILVSVIASATEITTTGPESATFDPSQLELIFSHFYDTTSSRGPVTLFGTRGGQRRILGNIYGTITARPTEDRIFISDGNYSKSSTAINFTVKGNMYVKKATSSQRFYPEITLITGTIGIYGMQIECRYPDCSHIEIDAETGKMKVLGLAHIKGRKSNEIISAAQDITLKPVNAESSVQITTNFETERQEREQHSQIGGYKLKDRSSGGYSFSINNDKIVTERIRGGVSISDVLSLNKEDYHAREVIRHFIQSGSDLSINIEGIGRPQTDLLKIQRGAILLADEEIFNTCIDHKHSCLGIFEQNVINIILQKFRDSIPTKANVNLDNGWARKIKVGRFDKQDAESALAINKPSALGNRKIIFTRDAVLVDGDWEDFGISFSAYLYRQQNDVYDFLECKINERKCYLNGRQTTLRQESFSCSSDEDCSEGVCLANRCVEESRCTRLIGNNDPNLAIDVLIAGEGEAGADIKNIARSLATGPNGLFNKVPFNRYSGKFNIWTMPINSVAVVPFVEGVPIRSGDITLVYENLDLSNCPEMDYRIVISKQGFRSNAIIESRLCLLSLREANPNLVLMHEFGHCFGGLADEYYNIRQGEEGMPIPPNCIAPVGEFNAEQVALIEWRRLLCGEEPDCEEAREFVEQAKRNWKGCGGDCDQRCRNYLRPSENSLMRDETLSTEYNTISRVLLEKRLRQY